MIPVANNNRKAKNNHPKSGVALVIVLAFSIF